LRRRRRRRRKRWAVKEEKRWAGASSVIIRGQKRDFRHKRAVKRKKPDIFIPYQLTPPLLSLFSPFFLFFLFSSIPKKILRLPYGRLLPLVLWNSSLTARASQNRHTHTQQS
jgi:hypothetical protein